MNRFRKFLNKQVFGILHKFDENLEKKREVTHWFYFKNLADLERFEKYTFEIGFKTMSKATETTKGDLLLIVYKTEGLNEDSINLDTIDFAEKAEEFNGFYDGWETRIELE
ncbi:MAG TPA: ribonuclease E inhibitor RraB [Flavobacteriaceae bacterium]|nr:ribonuclease E inhibitor RraB [Flavobacteriaceae bacterium]